MTAGLKYHSRTVGLVIVLDGSLMMELTLSPSGTKNLEVVPKFFGKIYEVLIKKFITVLIQKQMRHKNFL